jgi:hypothetical protein
MMRIRDRHWAQKHQTGRRERILSRPKQQYPCSKRIHPATALPVGLVQENMDDLPTIRSLISSGDVSGSIRAICLRLSVVSLRTLFLVGRRAGF